MCSILQICFKKINKKNRLAQIETLSNVSFLIFISYFRCIISNKLKLRLKILQVKYLKFKYKINKYI